MITLDDIRTAAERIRGQVERTPTRHSRVLSRLTGAEVYLKFENFQFTASFKERGALNKLSVLTPAERAAGVAAMSAGNHAQGVAYHATRLGIDSCIVMPAGTPFTKVRNTRDLGATVILEGDTLAESQVYMQRELVEGRGMTLVHPYDDPLVMAGQGTVALEMLEDAPDLDTLVVPVGGGGLIAGMAVAAHGLDPSIEMVGVESAGYASAYEGLKDEPGQIRGGPTIAEGIAVRNMGVRPMAVIRQEVSRLLRVEEASIERAIGMLANIEKVVVEGAGAAGLAALLADPAAFAGKRVGIVLCGGNIDPRMLASVLLRQLVHESRMVQLSVSIEDRPGFLARVAGVVGQAGGNIVQVHHERLHGSGSARSATLEILVETQDERHVAEIVAELARAGYSVHRDDHAMMPFE